MSDPFIIFELSRDEGVIPTIRWIKNNVDNVRRTAGLPLGIMVESSEYAGFDTVDGDTVFGHELPVLGYGRKYIDTVADGELVRVVPRGRVSLRVSLHR